MRESDRGRRAAVSTERCLLACPGLGWFGATEMVALEKIESEVPAGAGFLGAFDSFGDRQDPAAMDPADQVREPSDAPGTRLVQAANQATIELHHVRFNAGELIQSGRAGTEVIEGEFNTQEGRFRVELPEGAVNVDRHLVDLKHQLTFRVGRSELAQGIEQGIGANFERVGIEEDSPSLLETLGFMQSLTAQRRTEPYPEAELLSESEEIGRGSR